MDACYLAGLFDCNGEVRVTQGNAVLRVKISGKREMLEKIKKDGVIIGCTLLLTGITARDFLRTIQPYVKCTKAQVDYAVNQWCERLKAKVAYNKLVRDSASGMPKRGC